MDAWGIWTGVDLHGCAYEKITDAEEIKRFAVELCELIEMKRFGECQVVRFGADPKVAGFSMTQLIETSLVSGHFCDSSASAYIDIFSCGEYLPAKVANFARKFFEADNMKYQTVKRY